METHSDTHYVFVCQGKNCLTKGSAELLDHIRTALDGRQTFKVVPFICFGACTASPNIAVFPDRLWYSMVVPEQQHCVIQSIVKGEEISELSANVSNDLKELVFRMLRKPLGI
jgi:(2Fe-2S) ferredoxin